MVTMAEIRAKYPNPVRSINNTPQPSKYCVGGALCSYIWGINPNSWIGTFPATHGVQNALERANDSLGADQSLMFARLITTYNDMGAFDHAWAALDQALNAT